MPDYQELKSQVVSAALDLLNKGFLMATGGNISIRSQVWRSIRGNPLQF